ncbi:orotidine-5'-phosphate decarboxylase [Campylobacter sp. MIT 97-5078]|uniref:orotidine-5'-phosphate decarboxylase n=1 Tax=Campylobacter sp. MIT 97-5078 TaxID=1548153 RepID=UPI000513B04D|nr:orotidine-5'-phosphate decarboxylase [Campylobacter sp. MIT 97-5078]KGI55795.1 orotidine 5'-phosphate decarboxylase [Campylobacter sp. MIT 97-5078]KGI57642.1 orotidine 5'-phosphate decarboxylase [Campylobacter sp. MIT 97-5078]TQR26894.1 orotidine-5'-phosphate decarboxylase [Campylobacter sp. MIT 97-5078]
MKLCVALDVANFNECVKLAKELQGLDLWLKVGMRSFYRDGRALLEELKKLDFRLFLDLKLYDIPNTMSQASKELANLGVDMINLHASAGKTALSECMNALSAQPKRPFVLGVSALTSFDEQSFKQIYKQDINQAVVSFSKLAYEAGLDGMVCSALESKMIKEHTNENFLTLTPGIRPFKEASDDQKRVADLEFAKEAKADFIVVGRPIYKDKEPRKVCEKILAVINQA